MRILTFIYNLITFELMFILGGVGFVFFFLLFLSPREEGLVDPKMLGEVKIIEVRETSTIVENSYGIRVKVRQRVNESDVGQTKTLIYTDSYQFE